jgi:hypothetical protein
MAEQTLRERVEAIASRTGARAVGLALHDFAHQLGWSLHGDRWFHAASTI